MELPNAAMFDPNVCVEYSQELSGVRRCVACKQPGV